MVEANEIKGQSGNPAFLATIFEGIRLEAKLTGTEAARQQRVEGHLRVETDLVAALHAGRARVAAGRRAPVIEKPALASESSGNRLD